MGRWKKAVFIYPYEKMSKLSYNDFFPPLGLEYIATAVRDLVDQLRIIDMRYEKEPLSKFLHGVDVVGMSINWPHQREIALNLIEDLPEETTVIVGGIHATENMNEYWEASPRINIIVRGDGEEISQDIFSGKTLSNISGISYRRAGKIVHNETRVLPRARNFYPDRTLRRYRYRHRTIFGLSFGSDTGLNVHHVTQEWEFYILLRVMFTLGVGTATI